VIRRRSVLLALALTLAAAAAAHAHSLLLSSVPAANAVLTTSPPSITLRFNNRIEKRLSRVRLVDEHGTTATAPTTRAEGESAETLVAAVPSMRTAEAAVNPVPETKTSCEWMGLTALTSGRCEVASPLYDASSPAAANTPDGMTPGPGFCAISVFPPPSTKSVPTWSQMYTFNGPTR